MPVGRGWRIATSEQREVLMREFRTLLIRTYGGAVSPASNYRGKVLPFRDLPMDTDVMVRTEEVPSARDPIRLDYRLEKTSTGWKIYDVSILGVSLVQSFRDQFASEIDQHGVAGLINALRNRNKQLAAGER
jgi:phospholipid transport system substrate-binding protein